MVATPRSTRRRLLAPIGLVLGFLFCAYGAFFIGVKEDLPQPQGATRIPLSLAQSQTVFEQWPETANIRAGNAELFILRENSAQAADYYRKAYVERRGWREITPPPGQPRDKTANQQFTLLAFAKEGNRVIIALSTGENIFDNNNIFQQVLRTGNVKKNDNLALVVNWLVK